jgi:hypothetical protein
VYPWAESLAGIPVVWDAATETWMAEFELRETL